MNPIIFGKQPAFFLIWATCGLITLAERSITELDLGSLGDLAFLGFVLPIVLMVAYFVLRVLAALSDTPY